MKRKVEIGFIIGLAIVFALAVFKAREWQMYARLFPWMIGFPMIVLALFQLCLAIRNKGTGAKESTLSGTPVEVSAQLARWRTFWAVVWILGLLLAIYLLGFSISILLFTFLYLMVESKEKWWLAVLLSTLAWVFFFGLFKWGIDLPLPEGQLFFWLR